MVIEFLSVVVVIGCCLYVFLAQPRREISQSGSEIDLDVVDDDGLFSGWDGLTPNEREQRLALYHRRVRARIAEQERAWLQAQLRRHAKG